MFAKKKIVKKEDILEGIIEQPVDSEPAIVKKMKQEPLEKTTIPVIEETKYKANFVL